MADEPIEQNVITDSPADEGVSSDVAEIEVPGTPAAPEEDNEIAALDAAIESAPTPEAKKSAQDKRNSAWAQMRRDRQAAKEAAAKAREEAAFYRGQTEALQHKVPVTPPVQTAPVQPEVQLPPKPRPEEYTDSDGYIDQAAHFEALADWKAECKFLERDAQRAAEEQRRQHEQTANAQQSWEQQGEAKFPGFKQKIERQMMPVLNTLDPGKFQALTGALSDSPVSHDLAVYLSDNPGELRRLAGLSPFAAIKGIGELEKKLEKPKPKTTTSAPAPITPVQTGGEAIVDIMQLDGDEYLRALKNKVKNEGRGVLYR